MERKTEEFNRAKSKVADDLKVIVSDGEALLKSVTSASEDGYAARAKFAEQVTSVKAKLAEVSQPVMKKARQADDYVHGSPWTVIGAAAVLGLLIGFLAAKR
jgi:ElaB/YqjD/DUF883 family membrane-anchored ribosome-binding protein